MFAEGAAAEETEQPIAAGPTPAHPKPWLEGHAETMTLLRDVVLRAVAHAADAVVIVDVAGIICYWNDGAVRIFGYRAEEMLGKGYPEKCGSL